MSPTLLEEIADVLSRPRIRRRLTAEDAHLFLSDIAAQVVMALAVIGGAAGARQRG